MLTGRRRTRTLDGDRGPRHGSEGAPPGGPSASARQGRRRAGTGVTPTTAPIAGTSAGQAGVTRPGGRGPRRPPSCHDRSAAAARAKASNAEAGSRRSSTSSAPRPRCSRASRRRRSRANARAPSPSPAGSTGARSSTVSSSTASGELGVVRPRPSVDVVRPDRGPHVIDDAGLGVHVDRRCLVVLEPVDGDPVAAGRAQSRAAAARPTAAGGGEPPVLLGEVRQHGDHPQPGWARSASANVSATSLDQRYWSST